MAEYWKVTHRHRPYNIIPVAFYVTLEGKIPRTPTTFAMKFSANEYGDTKANRTIRNEYRNFAGARILIPS